MTNHTEIEPQVEQPTTSTLKEQHAAAESEHKHQQDKKSFGDIIFETADHPYLSQPMPVGGLHTPAQAGIVNIGVPHYEPKHDHDHKEHKHDHDHGHEHKHQHNHPDALHAFGDKLTGDNENAAVPIFQRPVV
ncbi:hypothetical protein EDD11_008151 [Mortierella claussenii]|nr:hypothetical protein EDD11_008151 [Mortierella claussenii]